MNPLAIAILLVLFGAVLALPGRWALVALASGALFLTQASGVEVAGFSIFPTRLLAYAAFARVLARGELSLVRLTKVDWMLILLYSFTTTVLVFRADESVFLHTAKLLDALCGYFALRGLIKGADDLRWFLGVLAFLLVPYVCLLTIERLTLHNPFALLGGREGWLRDGKIRCFGSFRHPSLLGSLGATFFPLFVALAFDRQQRNRALLGATLCVAVVLFSNSGGPISAWLFGIAGWLLWAMRQNMQLFRRILLGTFVLLAMIMKAPVWYLIAKGSNITGGNGWHRAYLIDVAMRNLDEWWLIGMPVKETASWMAYTLGTTGGTDITNQFLVFGISCGALGIILLIWLVTRSYKLLGRALAGARRIGSVSARSDEFVLWGLGVMLAVHVVNWLGISYFDQFELLWLLQLAAIVSVSQAVRADSDSTAPVGILDVQQFEEAGPREAVIARTAS